ncbi:MAG: hypothetical protein A3B70_03910 [Deltaproteobacteria bacterium RIFCSPHIGHO2_02_FULL_40_11]|nr:MAG: hypothetical protein A3B70_03910 [Deltaproteobacteria bacterium RIFCSPHIGHO2_02_FULL_40_11]
MSSIRERLIRMHKKILEGVQEEILSYMGRITPELQKYLDDYDQDFKAYQKTISKKDLISEIQKADIVYSGDYHTFVQSQKIPIRILREVVKRKKKIILGIEMVMSQHQVALDEYLNANITETEFLEDIEYERLWGFQWEHFKPIFEFAKEHHLKMVALNHRPKEKKRSGISELTTRDTWAAKIIARTALENPGTLLVVIFGDLHLAQNHLPLQVSIALKHKHKKIKTLTLHQNNEKLYWKLVKKGVEHKVDIVKLKKDAYCITNAPPWLKLQSYVHWIEKPEHYDQIYQIIKVITQFIDLKMKGLEDYHVYTAEEKKYLNLITSYFEDDPAAQKRLKEILQKAESFFVPSENFIYLKKMSVNHAAEEATIFIYTTHTGYTAYPESIEAFFYENLYLRTLGFLGSKIMNPKRRCEKEQDFTLHKNDPSAKIVRTFLRRLRHYMKGYPFNATLPAALKRSPWLCFHVSKALGHMLGEKLYQALQSNRLSHNDVLKLFEAKLKFHAAIEAYLYWSKKLFKIKSKYQSKQDRL